VRNWVARSSTERDVSRQFARTAFIGPLVGLAVIIAIRVLSMPTFRFLMEEDGLVEWLQFLAFLGAAVLAVRIALARWRDGHGGQSLVYGIAAVGLFFVAGEEIAWGSRLLALETPEWLRDINLQEEVTLHNISGVLLWFNLVLLGTSLYGVVADPINWRTRFADRLAHGRALFVPPFFLATAFAVMAVLRTYRLVIGGESEYTITKLIEWAELCYAAAVLGFLWLALRDVVAATGTAAANGLGAEAPRESR
jgi:hypothetical protein